MTPFSDTSHPGIDCGLAANFIHEFSVTRRHVLSYPASHPIIAAAAEKTRAALRDLIADRPGITFGIAKDTLIVGDTVLDKSSHAFRNLARLLFSHGIASVMFSENVTNAELVNFCKIISAKRETLDARGGIAAIMQLAAISGISFTAIDYGAFLATENNPQHEEPDTVPEKSVESIWHELVLSLLQGTLINKSDLSRIRLDLAPDALADMLNSAARSLDGTGNRHIPHEQIIAAFLKHLEQHPHIQQRDELLLRLNSLISRLTPEQRNQFLASAFKPLAENRALAEAFLSGMPEEALIDTLDAMIAQKESLPPVLLNLIGRLSSNLAVKAGEMTFAAGGSEKEELQEKLRILFKEESHDKFTPESYQAALSAVVGGAVTPVPERAELDSLKHSLEMHSIESQVSLILMEIINSGFDDLGSEAMLRNLLDLSGYFLSSGDFAALIQMHDRLTCQSAHDSIDSYRQLVQFFNEPSFIQEVIQGVNFWGKTKYQEIGNLIVRIGAGFVEPVLDRLADEQSMSVRRYYMEILQRIGEPARDSIIARLRDSRWYFVRNLILLLRSYEASQVIPQIRRLTGHPHPRVRQEAIRALLGFQDPEGDKLLLRDLADSNRETVINAVRLAEQSRHPEVIRALTTLLAKGGMSGPDGEMKTVVIHTLSMIGAPSVVPDLKNFLRSRSLFRSKPLTVLKIEIIRSLNRYPRHCAVPLLQEITEHGHREIRETARETLQSMQGSES